MKRDWLKQQIVDDLRAEQEAMPYPPQKVAMDSRSVEVRLLMNPTEHGIYWDLRYGDPSYDTDHTGFCGASVLHAHTETDKLQEVAEDLISQCEDHAARCDVRLAMD